MKKKAISLLLCGALTLGMVGCQSGSNQSATNTAKASGKVKLRVWDAYANNSQKAWLAAIDKFNTSQDKVEIVNEYIPFADIKKQLSIGLTAQNLPDIVVIDNPNQAAFSAMGLLEDLTPKINNWSEKDKYFEGPWKSTIYNGKNYAIPLDSNCLGLYYNVDMLQKAGITPPETWDQFRAAAKKLTKDGVYGLAMSAVKSEEGTFQFLPFLLSSGATVEKYNSAEGNKALSFVTQLVKDGSLSKEAINWTQTDVEKQFAAGKAAMMINGPWQFTPLKNDAPNLKYATVKIPKDAKFASVLGGNNIGIIKGHNVDAAWTFLEFLGKPENLKQFVQATGYFPPRKDLTNDKYYTDDANLKAFMDQMQYAMPRGPLAKWPQVSEAIYTSIQQSLTMQKSPEDALKEAQPKIDEAVK